MMERKCGSCRHYTTLTNPGDHHLGLCSVFPEHRQVHDQHWCGQYAPSISVTHPSVVPIDSNTTIQAPAVLKAVSPKARRRR